MRSTKSHRKALSALVFGLATAAVFSPTASARCSRPARPPRPCRRRGRPSVPVLIAQPRAVAGTLEPVRRRSRTSAGARPPTKIKTASLNLTARRPNVTENISGAHPTNLARATGRRTSASRSRTAISRQPRRGAAGDPRRARRLPAADEGRRGPSLSAAPAVRPGHLALGFGLGLILATAAAITLAMVRDATNIPDGALVGVGPRGEAARFGRACSPVGWRLDDGFSAPGARRIRSTEEGADDAAPRTIGRPRRRSCSGSSPPPCSRRPRRHRSRRRT